MNLLKSTIIATLTLVASPLIANAAEYKFNKYIGNIYVGDAIVYKNADNGVTAIARVNMPHCSPGYTLQGYIVFDYKSDDGGYFSNYKYNVTGQSFSTNVEAFVNVPYNMSDRGTLTIKDNTWCESIGETIVGRQKNQTTKGINKIGDGIAEIFGW